LRFFTFIQCVERPPRYGRAMLGDQTFKSRCTDKRSGALTRNG